MSLKSVEGSCVSIKARMSVPGYSLSVGIGNFAEMADFAIHFGPRIVA